MSSDGISSEDGLSAATQTVLYSLGAFFALTAAWAALLVGRLLWSFIPQSRHIDSQQEIASSSETDASSERHAAAKGVGMKQLLKESKTKQRGHVVTAPGSAHRLCINTLKGHADGVVGLSWSHDGSSIATASEDRAVRVFNLTDLTSRNINIKRKALLRAPVDVCFGATAEQLLVLTKGSLDAASLILLVPDAKTGAFDTIWQMESHHGGGAALSASSAWVEKANVGVILTCGVKTDLKVSSTRGVHLASIDTGGLTNHGAALSSDGRFIAAATFTVDVKIYEVSFDRSGAFQHVKKCMDLKGHNRQVRCVAFSPDCKRAVTASEDRTVKVWNLDVRYHMQEDPKLLMTIQQDKVPPSRYYTHIAFGPEGIIAASYERSLHFIDSASGRMLEVIEDAHDGSITQLMWRPMPAVVGGETVSVLATAGLDKRVRLWTAPREP